MVVVNYSQVGTSRLYHLEASSTAGVAGYWAGFYATAGNNLGDSPTLTEVWGNAGVFLFMSAAPAQISTFTAMLDQLITRTPTTLPLRMLWLQNPNDNLGLWQYEALQTIAAAAHQETVATMMQWTLGDYALEVIAGSTLALDGAADSLSLSNTAAAIRWVGIHAAYPDVAGTTSIAFSGAALGTLAFDISIPLPIDGNEGFAAMGVALAYATAKPDNGKQEVAQLAMPCLKQQQSAFTLKVIHDPLNPLIVNRTALSFDLGGSAPVFDSYWATTLGYGASLTPKPATGALGKAQLVFNRLPQYVVPSGNGQPPYRYYLTPNGAFGLTLSQPQSLGNVTTAASDNRLMIGLSGLEYVNVTNSSGTVYFQAGQNAYIQPDPDTTNALTATASTAYVTFLPATAEATGLGYFAQPLQAPLFDAQDDLPYQMLNYRELGGQTLPTFSSNSADAPPATFPVGAYKGLKQSLALAQTLENTIIAPVRREIIGTPTATYRPDAPDIAPLGITPQGLAALLTNDRQHWAGLVMANLASDTSLLYQVTNFNPDFLAAYGATSTIIANIKAQAQQLGYPVYTTKEQLTSAYQSIAGQYTTDLANVSTRLDDPRLSFTAVGPVFQAALQSNQLFMVAANPATLMADTSVLYQMTDLNAELLARYKVPTHIITDIKNKAAQLNYPVYPTEALLVADYTTIAGQYITDLPKVSGLLKPDIDGWVFQLSPRSWRDSDASPTIMVMNFSHQSIVEMTAIPSSWAWQDVAIMAGKTLTDTQDILLTIITDAATSPAGTPRRQFYDKVLNNPDWNGILFLNAAVSIADLPGDLLFITAGVNLTAFYAHHIGFSLTAFHKNGQSIHLEKTAAFGLIDYQQMDDLYTESTLDFAFKTQQINVQFANAALVDFSALVQLMVNKLFAGEVTKAVTEHGNNLRLNGSYQRVDGAPSYAFSLLDDNNYVQNGTAFNSINILTVQLQTHHVVADSTTIETAFVLGGKIRFAAFDPFDVFSYGNTPATTEGSSAEQGWLTINNLSVKMRFDLIDPAAQGFTVSDNQLSFDMANSAPREQSLAHHFPLKLIEIISVQDGVSSPTDLGYQGMSAPIDQTNISGHWYGLKFELQLGTLGALAGSIGIKIDILAGWSGRSNDTTPPVFIGIKLPDAKSAGLNLPLQGVLKLGFKSFIFETYDDAVGNTAYMLRLHRFALCVLGMSFPPGNTDMLVFGNPAPGNTDTKLGWYGAYAQTPKADDNPTATATATQTASQKRTARRLQSGRREHNEG